MVEAQLAFGGLVFSALGAAIDVRTMKIPNWLTAGGLIAALLYRSCVAGASGLGAGLIGAALGGGFLFLPFVLRGMGGGDVKLMAAAGGWVGTRHTVALILATAIAGGILGIVHAALRRRLGVTIMRTARLIGFHLASGIEACSELETQSEESICFPYSLAIAAGCLFVFATIAVTARG